MKFTLQWLKDHLETEADLATICDKLTAIGLEVDSVTDPGASLKPFIIAHVLTAEKHPQADRLKVTTVDTGSGTLQVVCGAPNCRAGIKAVLARPGDVMPDSGEALKKGVIRGVESQGMLCAADELKLGDDHEGIIEVAADAPVGASYADYAGLNDPVIEIKLTPNRPDCAGVAGIARDLAAAGLGKLKSKDVAAFQGAGPSPVKVTFDFPAGDTSCPLFVGRLIRGLKNGPSPHWLQQRLQAIGLRPISALVDVTNFLTFDRARPLHVFDARKIKGDLRIFGAKGGETFTGLNGKDYTLEPGMTAIGDASGVVSLAGLMGGSSTGCDAHTSEVFIEAALFDPARTAKTGRALQITSDARYRFERGVDPHSAVPGVEAATRLILEMCATDQTWVSDLLVVGAAPRDTRSIAFDATRVKKYIGVDVTRDEQVSILERLGFQVTGPESAATVTPPSWRPDIESKADLVEEVIRIKGYDLIPSNHLERSSPVTVAAIDLWDVRANALRRGLAGQGLLEAVTYSFLSEKLAKLFGGGGEDLRLLNPISVDLEIMRPSLLANLLSAAQRNADRGFWDCGLFEVGPVYRAATDDGQTTAGAALRMGHTPRHWAEPRRVFDVFDAKADALAGLAAAGAPVAALQVTTDAPPWYHPGRSGCLRLGPALLATFGALHPGLLREADITEPVVATEIFVQAIPAGRGTSSARPLLKLDPLQPIERDFAFVVDRSVSAAKLIKAVRDGEKTLIREINVFDVYEGKNVEAGKKSVAVSVTLQPGEKSLTDAEIEAVCLRITANVAKATGASLRQ